MENASQLQIKRITKSINAMSMVEYILQPQNR